MTQIVTHPELVRALAKPGEAILAELTPERCHLLHMAGCIGEEAGEVFGVIKKHVFYNKPLDLAKVIEELGDIEFYLEGLRQGLGIDRETVLQANIDKLSKRYAGLNYSDAAAQARVDQH